MRLRSLLPVVLSALLANAPVAPAATATAVGKMNTKGTAEVNGMPVPATTTVFVGDRIITRMNTASALALRGGDQVLLPERTTARVSRVGSQLTIALEQGAVAVVSRSAEPVWVEANGVRIQPSTSQGGVYEVALNGNALKVVARRGPARVTSADSTIEVSEGMALKATVVPVPQGPAGAAAGLSGLQAAVLVAAVAAGVTGLALGIAAQTRNKPQDCVVVSPNRISCP